MTQARIHVQIHHPNGETVRMQVPGEAVIGRSAGADIQLNSWRVGKEHARLVATPSGVLLEDMGAFGGVAVNGRRVEVQHGPLKATDDITVGPFRLRARLDDGSVASLNTEPSDSAAPAQPKRNKSADPAAARRRRMAVEQREASHRQAMRVQAAASQGESGVAPQAPAADERPANQVLVLPNAGHRELEYEWRKKLHARLLDTMDLRRHDITSLSDAQLREQTQQLIQEILAEEAESLPPELDQGLLAQQVLAEAVGLGPLEELLADDSITEIMVNRFDEIYIERAGRLLRHPLTFTDDTAVMSVIERIVTPIGRRIDESSPMVDARLKDGSRVNAIIPPLALKGPCVTIRKFAKRKLQAADLVRTGSISPEMATFMKICVAARKNIIISGGTGSGKTTLLNILSNFIPLHERIVTVEDAAELKLNHEHLVSLESRPSNLEGRGVVTIRDLVRNTLRMRPDRIVVGECRGAEALDMLQAMNTGHEGSLTTLHANSPRDALARLETMVLMAGMELPLVAIREQIASAIDIIVQQTRFACGTRVVNSITEVTGIESGRIQLQEILRFEQQGYSAEHKIRGYFTGCDSVPTFYEDMRAMGMQLDLGIFQPAHESGEMAREHETATFD